jgi:putative ABC transport system permease protein
MAKAQMKIAAADYERKFPKTLGPRCPITFAIRTKQQPFSLSADIQRELRAASGDLPVAHVQSIEQIRGESTARNDFNMTLLTVFAAVGLLLALSAFMG